MNTTESGHIAEKLFEIKALRKGWEVCQPVCPTPYDYIISRDGGQTWEKIQVKKAYIQTEESGTAYARITTVRTGSNYNKRPYADGDYDYIAMVIVEEDSIYLIPFDEVANRTKITKPVHRKIKAKMGRPLSFDWDSLEM
jgi:hypothetical protein